MGWWGCGVMEGDGPADIAGLLSDFVLDDARMESSDLAAETRHNKAVLAERLRDEATVTRCFQAIQANAWKGAFHPDEAAQVLVALIIEHGGVLIPDARRVALAFTRQQLSGSYMVGWFEPEKRQAALRQFLQEVETYAGVPNPRVGTYVEPGTIH